MYTGLDTSKVEKIYFSDDYANVSYGSSKTEALPNLKIAFEKKTSSKTILAREVDAGIGF